MLPKIMLLTPPGRVLREGIFHTATAVPPLGLGYLAAVLDKNKFNTRVVDAFAQKMTFKNTCALLENEKPEIVGVTFTTEKRFDAFALIRAIRKILPSTTIIAGGPHSSLAAEDTLRGIPEIDFIVRGEGEVTFPELVGSLDGGKITQIDGISYRSGNDIIHNKERDFIEDLDMVPFPDYSQIDLNRYDFTLNVPEKGKKKAASIIANRGCPYGCSFCATTKMWGKRFRARSVTNIINEIAFLMKKYNIDCFWILDDTFTVDKRKVEEFCNEILQRNWGINWYCSIRVDTVDKGLLKLMKKAGLAFVTYGIESGSERIVKEVIGKRITIEKGKQVSEWCKELDIKRRIFFMFSFPDETKEEFALSLSLIKELGGDTTLSVLRIYPGTRIEALAKERGILPKDFSWTKDDNEFTFLRFLMGNSPIFLDKFSWFHVFKYLFMWSDMGQGYLKPYSLIPELLKEIKSFKDVYKLCMLGTAFLAYKFEKLIKGIRIKSR